MIVKQKVLALGYRTGKVSKETANKGKPYVSLSFLDSSGNFFDLVKMGDAALPSSLSVPCLLDCVFDIGYHNQKNTVDLVSIDRKSASFDLDKLFEMMKLPMEKA